MTTRLKSPLATLTAALFAACLLIPTVGATESTNVATDPAKETAPHDHKAKHPLKQKIDNVKEKMDAAQDKRKKQIDASEE